MIVTVYHLKRVKGKWYQFALPRLIQCGQIIYWLTVRPAIPFRLVLGHHQAGIHSYNGNNEVWEAVDKGFVKTFESDDLDDAKNFIEQNGFAVVDFFCVKLNEQQIARFKGIQNKPYDFQALVSHAIYILTLLLAYIFTYGLLRKGVWIDFHKTGIWKIYCNEAYSYILGDRDYKKLLPIMSFYFSLNKIKK